MIEDLDRLILQLTLDEKISLLVGNDSWSTKAIPRLNIPSIFLSDGPAGLRKYQEVDGVGSTLPAVSYPCEALLASTWNKDVLYKVGEAIGNDAIENDVDIVLGPGVNIKRSPVCGRNFEYFSEDPYLSGILAAAMINGIESRGVGSSIKHFLANNQEHRRLCINSIIDEKALHEIYLASFEFAIKNSKPSTVMCSYNKVNGEYVCESKHFLTEILRQKWGFDGVVVSDWGATNDRQTCAIAGMDLEMPYSGTENKEIPKNSVLAGTCSVEIIDACVKRILDLVFKQVERKQLHNKSLNSHDIARDAVIEGAVLLKNNNILPLDKSKLIAVIGDFAVRPRLGAGGSSHVIPTKVENILEEIEKIAELPLKFANGYEENSLVTNNVLLQEAIEVAKGVESVIIVVGLPSVVESEGYDRTDIDLPEIHTTLINEISKVNSNIVIILQNGSPVAMPWLGDVKAVMLASLFGQSGASAIAQLIFGLKNPSGKLAETYPAKLQHNPSYLFFPGNSNDSVYGESNFVGYRYYDAKKIKPLFPFGFGLTYTKFEYTNLETNCLGDDVQISFKIKNTGNYDGAEIWQIYTGSDIAESISSPKTIKQLFDFGKVYLAKGEEKQIISVLNRRAFSEYCLNRKDFVVNDSIFNIFVAASSQDIKLSTKVVIRTDCAYTAKLNKNSTIGDVLSTQRGRELFAKIQDENADAFDMLFCGMEDDGSLFKQMMTHYTVLRSLNRFSQGIFSNDMLNKFLKEYNNE